MEEPNEKERKGQWVLKFPTGFILGFLIVVFLSSLCCPLSPSKELSRRALCGANLKAIGTGVKLYASENDDLFPPDLATLVQDGNVFPGMLVCLSSGTERATTTRPADVEAHCDYMYVSGFNWNTPGGLILTFELPANHGQKWVNVLYVDTHVKGTGDMTVFVGELQRLNDYQAGDREAER